METRDKILKASQTVFIKHGYLGTSTKAIAQEADVSEMTLFRKFNSKQNLFETMIKTTLVKHLAGLFEETVENDLKTFVKTVLHNRLETVSRHCDLVRMIIQESIQGRIPEELNFITVMSNHLSETIQTYQKQDTRVNGESLSTIILGILLHYAILTPTLSYHTLSKEAQNTFIETKLAHLKL